VFENGSRFEQIKTKMFSKTHLQFARIPASIEILGEICFSEYESFSSVQFESGSRLSRTEDGAFSWISLLRSLFLFE
jgi:hypothetical protein